MTRRTKMALSLENILLSLKLSIKRTWCYKKIMISIICATSMLVIVKLTDPLEIRNVNIGQSDYQDTNNMKMEKIFRRRFLPNLNGTKKYCYRSDDEMGETILFIHFNKKWTHFDTCAVKTASIFNKHTPICVLHAGPDGIQTVDTYLDGINNVQVAPLDILEIFKGTPLYDWYSKIFPESPKRRFFQSELTDALRAAYLYKYGGTYLDTDVWTLRSFENLGHNSLAREHNDLKYVSNFVMSFQKKHPFVFNVVNQFNQTVNATKWGSGGSLLLSKLYEEWEREVEKEKKNIKIQRNDKNKPTINLVSPESFYPVHFSQGPVLFQSSSYNRVVNLTKDAYTVHLWREVYRSYWNGKSIPQKGSFVWVIQDQYCAK